ncbi:MAG: hypothetical protein PF693_18395, partial [Spirochaetia bacterium]|nr:hypothetical protein [Spirochaetia bacterium]
GTGGAGSSTKKMETEFESTERQLEGLYSTLGQVYIEESLENKITSKEIEKIFLNIQSLKKENSNSDKQILKLEAAINIDQVEKDINEIDNRILRMNREIQEKQDEINTLTQRNGELEIDKKKQMKIRGSKSSLELEFTNNKGE